MVLSLLSTAATAAAATRRAFDDDPRPSSEVVLAEKSTTDDQNPEATGIPTEGDLVARDYRYPLSGSSNAPAKIVFTAHKIKPFFNLDEYVDTPSSVQRETQTNLEEVESVAQKTSEETEPSEAEREKGIIEGVTSNTKAFFKSYENTNANNPVGSVTLPMFRGLQYQDGVQYNIVDVGILGAAGDIGQVSTDDGRLMGATKALGSQFAAKAIGGLSVAGAGAAASSLLGTGAFGGAIVGGVAGGNIADQAGAVAKSATRVSMAPNERTLFERVNMRSFAFVFKMIAKNREESREIKNIIKFFRHEVYPEAIRITEGGLPFAYEFPNVFSIDIKNKVGNNPGFNIQRCYLESVNTTFNQQATGLYEGEEFIEVDVSLNFRELSAMDKTKVRQGF